MMKINNHTKKEIWKDIPGFEGMYQVSSNGRVKSLARAVKRINCGKYPSSYRVSEKILTQHLYRGYLHVLFSQDGRKIKKSVHRIVATVFVPNPCNKPVVNHIDTDKKNNFYQNLEWCTPRENSMHASENNLMPTGEKNGSSVLNKAQVIAIKRHALKKGKRYGRRKLAIKYGVSETTIKKIVAGKAWRHV